VVDASAPEVTVPAPPVPLVEPVSALLVVEVAAAVVELAPVVVSEEVEFRGSTSEAQAARKQAAGNTAVAGIRSMVRKHNIQRRVRRDPRCFSRGL
jgi:hypothetical protein